MRTIIVLIIVLLVGNLTLAQDFEGMIFGDSKSKIMNFHNDAEWQDISINNPEVDTITYTGSFQELEALVEFVLIEDELVAGTYHFGDDSSEKTYAKFVDIFPKFRKEYGIPDNLHEKTKFQKAIWHIGGPHPYFIELNGGHGLVKAHFDWYEKIEDYNKEAKKVNKSSMKKK